MKDILVIADPVTTDSSEEQIAFSKALELAGLTDASIHIVVFCYESISFLPDVIQENETLNIKSALLNDRETWWGQFIQRHQSSTQVSYEVVWEKYPHSWIVEHCKTRHYDLLVKTGHRSESMFYTPTDWQLFRQSTVPVYSVTQNNYEHKKVVVVALDLMAVSEEKQKLNKGLLEAAFQLSIQTDSQLHCCFAIKLPAIVKELDLIDVSTHKHKVEKQARLKNQAWLDDYDIKSSCIHIEQGTPWKVINSLSQKLKAHCIVIGSMGRTGVAGKLIGNTAEKVIHHTKTNLLVITPC